MKLEEEIKQKSFGSPHHRMLVNIMFTGNWVQKEIAAELKPFGLSLQQYNVLSILRGQFPNPSTLRLVQERMLDRDSNATRLVDKLLEKELVTRIQSPENRRKVDILITQKGLNLLQQTDGLMQVLEKRFNHLSGPEATQIGNWMDQIRER